MKKNEVLNVGDVVIRDQEAGDRKYLNDSYISGKLKIVEIKGDLCRLATDRGPIQKYEWRRNGGMYEDCWFDLESLTSVNNMSNEEKEYRATVTKIKPLIEESLEIAAKAVQDAVDLADKYGVPFHGMCQLTQQYTPSSRPRNLSDAVIAEITGCSLEDGDEGWQQSSIC